MWYYNEKFILIKQINDSLWTTWFFYYSLQHVRIISLVGFEAFLTSMVAKEVETLPRGIYHSSLRRQGAAANQGKAIGSIPSFLLSQYQKTKQPGLRPGLAGKISQSRFKTWSGRWNIHSPGLRPDLASKMFTVLV